MNVLRPLFEDNHLLVLNKPAGLPTMGADAGADSLLVRAKEYLKEKYQKPGNVYLGVVSRIDALVTGVVVFARTSKAAARLSEQFREGSPQKTYLALVHPPLKQASGRCENWMIKDEANHRMRIARPNEAGAQRAELSYQVLASDKTVSAFEVQLLTGRKHQIRVQLAALGSPILGDVKYGSNQTFPSGIALHAKQLTIEHPVQKQPLTFTAPLPASWKTWKNLVGS